MKPQERTRGATLALFAAAVCGSATLAQQPGYVGRPIYFDSPDPTTRVNGQPVPRGAIGYTLHPGGGLTWEYGRGGSSYRSPYSSYPSYGSPYSTYPSYGSFSPSHGSSYPSYPSYPSYGSYSPSHGGYPYELSPYGGPGVVVLPYGGGYGYPPPEPGLPPLSMPKAPRASSDTGGVTWYDGRVYASVNGLRPPKDAVGHRFDGSTGQITWLTQADRDRMEGRARPTRAATPGATPAPTLTPTVPRSTGPSEAELARRTMERRRADLAALSLAREKDDPSDAVKKRKADALARLGADYAEIPEPPAALDPTDTRDVDAWVSTVNASKYGRLRALYQIATATTVDELRPKQALWIGRCTMLDAPDREDGAMLGIFPSGASALVALNTRPYDVSKKEFVDRMSFAELDRYDATAVGQVAAKLFQSSSDKYEPLAKSTIGSGDEAEALLKADAAANTVIGVPYRIHFRKLKLGNVAALSTRIGIEGPDKAYRPVAYCLFTKRWEFR